MKRTIVQWPRVEHDLAEYYSYIAMDKIDPAERLLSVAKDSIERLAENPRIGVEFPGRRPRVKGVRIYPMPAPYRSYCIVYRATESQLEVIAILHGALNLEAMIRRLLG